MKDSLGNIISATLFESYLSQYLIEHPEYFEPVYQKILASIEAINAQNATDPLHDRMMYNITSLMMQEFKEFENIQSLREKPNLFTINYFFKSFCDSFLKTGKVKVSYERKPSDQIPSLSSLCLHSLFRSPSGSKALYSYMRPKELFHENNRGARLAEKPSNESTRKLGITTIETTPEELLLYFPEPYQPSQFEYVPNRKSNVGKWMDKYNLPIISGSSGSAVDYLCSLISLVELEPGEIKLLLIGLAATLVAKGHHSYFEIIIIMDRFGFKLRDTTDLYSFYEQTLPKEIVLSESYQQFKNSKVGTSLLNGITVGCEQSNSSRMLPDLSIAALVT